MELIVTASDVEDAQALTDFLRSHRLIAPEQKSGLARDIEIVWQDAQQRSGMWESLTEWLGTIDLSSVPLDVAVGLISNYLWDIFTKIKPKTQAPLATSKSEFSVNHAKTVQLFDTVVKVRSLSNLEGQYTEIDLATSNPEAIKKLLLALYNHGDTDDASHP